MGNLIKLSRDEKCALRRYRKAQKKYEKQLISYIKEEEKPYDWFSMVEILIKMIKRRLDYYSCGDNVWQTDEACKSVVETLKIAYQLGVDAIARDNIIPNAKNCTYADVVEDDKQVQDAYIKFFSYVAANMRSWWD